MKLQGTVRCFSKAGRFRRFVLLSCVLLEMCGSARAIVLIRDGQPECTLVLVKNASPAERYAAEELNGYLDRIAGVRLPMEARDRIPSNGKCILLGRGSWLSLPRFMDCSENLEVVGSHGFIIQSVGNGDGEMLAVVGGSRRGTVYAVYEILKRIGVRWYTKDVTKIPRLRTVDLGSLSVADFPCFDIRDVPAGSSDLDEWRAHLRLNAGRGFLEDRFGCAPEYAPLELAPGELLPASLLERHPEYYPSIEGRRSPESGLYCFSNPKVIRAVADSISARVSRAPGTTHVIPMFDSPDAVCQCAACARITRRYGGETGLILSWLNMVAGIVTRKHHTVCLELDPAWITFAPPASVQPHPAVAILLTGEELDADRPLTGSAAGPAAVFLRVLRRWADVSDRVYVSLPYSFHDCPAAPFPFLSQASRNLIACRDRYATAVFFRSPSGETVFSPDPEMNTWVLSELMWDADIPVESLVREWLKGVCGAAYGPMMDYWRHVQKIKVTDNSRKSLIGTGGPDTFLDDRWLNAADRMFQRAYALSLTNRTANHYVRKARLNLWYARLLIVEETIAKGEPLDAAARTKYLELLDKFVRDFREFGFTRVTAARSLEEFAEDMRNVLRNKGMPLRESGDSIDR